MSLPGIEVLGTATKFRGRKRSLKSCVYVLHKKSLEGISRRSRAVTTKKCTKKCAARAKLLLLPSLVDVVVVVLKFPNKRPLDSNTRTTTRKGLTLSYFISRILKKYTPRNTSMCFFSPPKKLASFILLKEVNYSRDRKMINYLTVDGSLFPPLRHSR